MCFLSLHPKKVSALIFLNHLLLIYSPIPQQALDKHCAYALQMFLLGKHVYIRIAMQPCSMEVNK